MNYNCKVWIIIIEYTLSIIKTGTLRNPHYLWVRGAAKYGNCPHETTSWGPQWDFQNLMRKSHEILEISCKKQSCND